MSYSCMAQIFTECLPFAPLSPFISSIYELCISTGLFFSGSRTDALEYK